MQGVKGAKGEGRAFEENNLREQAVWIPSSLTAGCEEKTKKKKTRSPSSSTSQRRKGARASLVVRPRVSPAVSSADAGMDDARARRRSALAATLVALSFFASVHAVVLALALLLTPLAAVALAVDRGGRCVRALAALARRGGS